MKKQINPLVVLLLLSFIFTSSLYLSCESPTKTNSDGEER